MKNSEKPLRIVEYNDSLFDEWNDFVISSKNSTFLLNRNFMEYHKDRFTDCSLLFYNDEGKLRGLLPANIDFEKKLISSHGGLTYGGLLLDKSTIGMEVCQMIDLSMQYYRNKGIKSIIYKPIPYIYHSFPCQEDIYFLWKKGAKVISRGISQTIVLNDYSVSHSRRVGASKAKNRGLIAKETNDVDSFWNLLNDMLLTCHNTTPVHSVSELRLLMARFPSQIRLFATFSQMGKMLAGTLIFDCGQTVHTQYMASSEEGKKNGALDLLILHLLTDTFKDRTYFDFGISTESNGKILNEGLLYQKETFGGRSVCYDIYQLDL